jgi:hypothetical protein
MDSYLSPPARFTREGAFLGVAACSGSRHYACHSMNNTNYHLRRARCAFLQASPVDRGMLFEHSATDRVENVDEGGAAGEYSRFQNSLEFATPSFELDAQSS